MQSRIMQNNVEYVRKGVITKHEKSIEWFTIMRLSAVAFVQYEQKNCAGYTKQADCKRKIFFGMCRTNTGEREKPHDKRIVRAILARIDFYGMGGMILRLAVWIHPRAF